MLAQLAVHLRDGRCRLPQLLHLYVGGGYEDKTKYAVLCYAMSNQPRELVDIEPAVAVLAAWHMLCPCYVAPCHAALCYASAMPCCATAAVLVVAAHHLGHVGSAALVPHLAEGRPELPRGEVARAVLGV